MTGASHLFSLLTGLPLAHLCSFSDLRRDRGKDVRRANVLDSLKFRKRVPREGNWLSGSEVSGAISCDFQGTLFSSVLNFNL